MAGKKCFVCHFVFEERKRFETDWENTPHENPNDCIKALGDKVAYLMEALNIVEERFRYERQKGRKEII